MKWFPFALLVAMLAAATRPAAANGESDADGWLLVADSREGLAFVLSAADLSVRRSIEVGAGARQVALSDDGQVAAVSRSVYNAVSFIDTVKWTGLGAVALAGEQDRRSLDKLYYPVGVAYWDGAWWVACGWRDRLVELDARGLAVRRRLVLEAGDRETLEPKRVWPACVVVDPRGRLVFSAFRAGRLGRLTGGGSPPGDLVVDDSLPVALSPWGLAVLDEERLVVASMDDSRIVVVDCETLEVRACWAVPGGAMLVARAESANSVVVGLRAGRELVRLDLETGKTTARRPLGGAPGGLVVAEGRRVFVTVPSRSELLSVSLPDLELLEHCRLGSAPTGLAYGAGAPPPAGAARSQGD